MKSLPFFLLLIVPFFSHAQQVSGMQDNNLPATSHWVASDTLYGTGGFASQGMFFTSIWDTSFGGYWSSGFALSSMTDSVTPGYTNMYSCRSGSGFLSDRYAISYGTSVIKTTNGLPFSPVSLRITNTTYTALSMRDGDSFAKKFGGNSGNDPDFFRLLIKGYRQGQELPDSVTFYLADYRFSDNSQDYIVNDWRLVNLSSLGPLADSLVFSLSSSDNGSFGMNTPAYFAIDDVTWQAQTAGVNESKAFLSGIYPNPCNDKIFIQAEGPVFVSMVTDAFGKVFMLQHQAQMNANTLSVASLAPGLYFLHLTDGMGQKSVLRFVKNG